MSRRLSRDEWQSHCDRLSRALVGERAELEVVSLDLGDQVQDDWVRLHGVAYDPRNDVFEIALEGLDHLIERPQEVYVEEDPAGLASMEIVDAEGTRQILRMREPVTLPAPS